MVAITGDRRVASAAFPAWVVPKGMEAGGNRRSERKPNQGSAERGGAVEGKLGWTRGGRRRQIG